MKQVVTGSTRVVGILGFPVQHSMSPAMHNAAFKQLSLDFIYVPFNVRPEDLGAAVKGIRSLSMAGANVTIPHKERVIEYLDWVSDEARSIGSVNTIVNDGGVLRGYTTDGEGFIAALEAFGGSGSDARAVVIGAGGSARAIVYALASRNSNVAVINRTYSRAVSLADSMNLALGKERVTAYALEDADAMNVVKGADLLVNCTSVGMHPKVDEQPVPSNWLHKGLFVFDQIYNPMETSLIRAAKEAGLPTGNGILMLVFQGASSFRLWTGQTPPADIMKNAVFTTMSAEY